MTKRAIIYARVSTEEQADNFSLDSQIAACQRYASTHDFDIIATLQDVMSGAKLERPALTEARNLIQAGAIDALIIHTSDRLTRSVAHSLLLRDELKHTGVELHCVTKGQASADTPEGGLMETIEAAFAEYERLKIRERSLRGKRQKAESGQMVGHGGDAPYGYRWEGVKREKQLVIIEEEAAIVRQIADWLLGGTTVPHICMRLTELRIPTPGDTRRTPTRKTRGYGEWNYTTIYCILRSTTYVGIYKQGQGNYAYRKTKTPATMYIDVPVPPILDKATWDAIQQRLDEGRAKYNPRNGKRQYLLSGHLRCQCGYAGGGRTSVQPRKTIEARTYRYYYCLGNNVGALRTCRMPQFPMDAVDAAVWDWIDQAVLNEAHIRAAVADREDVAPAERARMEGDKEGHYRRLAELDDEEQQYQLLFGKRRITFEKYEQLVTPIETARASVRREIEKLEARLAALTTTQEGAERLCALVREIRGNLERGVSMATRRQVMELLDVEVTLVLHDGEKFADVVCYLTLDAKRLRLSGMAHGGSGGVCQDSSDGC